jgi:uncharacterized glyoxalase superfamily protein PhnB
MSQSTPPVYEHFVPHLICDPCPEAIEFYKKALGAEETFRMPAQDGKRILHACLKVGNAMFFVNDDFPEFCGKSQSPQALQGTPVTMHRYVDDVDGAIQKAVDAGATVVMPAADMFWGDRYGIVLDPFGHSWSFAKHIKDMTPEEMTEAMKKACDQDE